MGTLGRTLTFLAYLPASLFRMNRALGTQITVDENENVMGREKEKTNPTPVTKEVLNYALFQPLHISAPFHLYR